MYSSKTNAKLTSPTCQELKEMDERLEVTDEIFTNSVDNSEKKCVADQPNSSDQPKQSDPLLPVNKYRKIFNESAKASAQKRLASESIPQTTNLYFCRDLSGGENETDASMRVSPDATDGRVSSEDSSGVSSGKVKRLVTVKRYLDASEDIAVGVRNELDTKVAAASDPTNGRSSLEGSSRVGIRKRKQSVSVKRSIDTLKDINVVAGPSGIRPRPLKQGVKGYVFNVCDEEISHSHPLGEDYNAKHSSKVLRCKSRSKVSAPKTSLQSNKTNTKDNLSVCNMCGKKFFTDKALKAHCRSHIDEKSFVCPVCSKAFARKPDLNNHRRIHTGEKPYVCKVCTKAFSQRWSLDSHSRTHTGEKPHVCDVCMKEFARISALNRHCRTHTDEKIFVCEVCEQKFSRKEHLLNHRRKHTGDKPYKCSVCQKGFAEKTHLNRHYRTHTDEKPYVCEVCQKGFAQKSDLNRHCRTHTDKKTIPGEDSKK